MNTSRYLCTFALGLAASLTISGSSFAKAPARCPGPTQMLHGQCEMPIYPKMGQLHNWAEARNPNNPFDLAGLQHNAVLADFTQSDQGKAYQADILAGHMQSFDTYFVPYFKLPPHYPRWPWPFPFPGGNGPYDPGPLLDFATTVKKPNDWMNLNPNPTKIYLKYMRELKADVQHLVDTGDYNQIIATEAHISSDRKVTERDRKYLLRTASVARYSYAFHSDPNNGWSAFTINWDEAGVVDAICGGLTTPAGGAVCSIIDIVYQILF